MTHAEFLKLLRQMVVEHGGASGAASSWGCSEAYLANVLRNNQLPSDAFLAAVGYRRVVRYERVDA